MKKSKIFIKTLSLVLAVMCILPLLISCNGRELAQSSLAKKEVGMVGSYTVQYEEFYFVANNYYKAMKEGYGSDTEGLKRAVWDKSVQNLASDYYAILTLCENEGIEYDPDALKGDIEDYVEKQIAANFDGSRSDYFKSQQEVGLTDHYVRFTIGVDLMYNKLLAKYQENGTIPNSDEKIKDYIKNNFIHTWHIAVVVDENENRDEQFKKAQGLLEKLNNGESFYSLMAYSEDFVSESLSGVYGTYFHKGEMTPEYENASFALKNNEYSDIIVSTARQEDGSMLECFYIIQRLPIKESEIEANLNTLASKVNSAVVMQNLASVKSVLKFEPNEYAKSLDVSNLQQPTNGMDYQVVLIVSACVLICAIAVTLVIIYKKVRFKKFNQLKKKN